MLLSAIDDNVKVMDLFRHIAKKRKVVVQDDTLNDIPDPVI